jgi:hypothetical protein
MNRKDRMWHYNVLHPAVLLHSYRGSRALAGRFLDAGNSPHDPDKRWSATESVKTLPQG